MPKGTFRDCKQSPRSRPSPDFGSSPIQKVLCPTKRRETEHKKQNIEKQSIEKRKRKLRYEYGNDLSGSRNFSRSSPGRR
ncbi:hypothetical protein DW655_05060 [Lachnospiraceae bacterium AM23-2LB]|nr:hypothetical protein DW655_05060 [Lachnospiraceae bacterium AM23-2LB]RJW04596.1 hypothetical protein DW887_02530 [Lachnospiraceae bacterium AM40-2BH]